MREHQQRTGATHSKETELAPVTSTYTHGIGQRQIPVHERIYSQREFELRLIEATREHVYHVMRVQGTPGLNLALGYRGELIWEAGFGYADVASRRPMTCETVYHSGSLGKTYTATAVMHLVDRGTLRLEDPINRHLPFEVHNPLGKREITIRDLMTHRSGLGGDAAVSHFRPPRPLIEEVRAEYATDPPARKYGRRWRNAVGERFVYSNLGLATLGLIVETANDERLSFSEYVQKYVMDPLGMTSSQYPPVQDQAHVRPDIWEKMSTGYTRIGAVWIPALPVYFGAYPAGGALAKPADHLRLMFAMLWNGSYRGYQLLKPDTVRMMISPAHDEPILAERGPCIRQGLIWRVSNSGQPNEKFWHSGGHMYGWRTQGVAWPTHGMALAAASNQWALPDGSTDVLMVEEFIESWLKYVRDVPSRAAAKEWARKVSYVRGVLFVASYKVSIGIPEVLPEPALASSIDCARLQPEWRDDWDPETLKRGISDISKTDFSHESIYEFWKRSTVVTEEEVRAIYQELGGRLDPVSYSIKLLPPIEANVSPSI